MITRARCWSPFGLPRWTSSKKHYETEASGNINLKTDSKFLHGYTLGVLDGFGLKPLISNHDIYNHINAPEEAISIQTFYEKKYKKLGRKITYLKFNFINETKR